MCDVLFQDKALNKLVLNGQISQFSALSTEKFNRRASSWQHEFFTIDVECKYELNGIGRILPWKCAHVKKSIFPYFPYPNIFGINLPNSNNLIFFMFIRFPAILWVKTIDSYLHEFCAQGILH